MKEAEGGVYKPQDLVLEGEEKCLVDLFCFVFQCTFECWENLGHYFFYFIRLNQLESVYVCRVEKSLLSGSILKSHQEAILLPEAVCDWVLCLLLKANFSRETLDGRTVEMVVAGTSGGK